MKTKMTSNLFGSVLCGPLMIGLLMTAACGGAGPSSLPGAGSGSSQMGFTATGSMQTARAIHTATLLTDGKVLITGGQGACKGPGKNGSSCSPLSSAELFDPAVGSFTSVAGAMTSPGRTVAIPLLSGKVLIIGGQSCGFGFIAGLVCGPLASAASAELFDPAAGTFTATGNMAVARAFPTATRLLDGRVLVTGASGDTSAELFDEATGTFTFTGSMGVARAGATASRLQNGQVLIVGGDVSGSAELYDPASGTFNATGAMATARSGHTATLLSNGKVLVAGGDFGGSNGTVSAELFDPATGQFKATGNMNTDRALHTAVLLNDGKVLLAGGLGSGGTWQNGIASAELFDPATGQFSAVANMKSGRDQHTATLLANGTVLVTGGFNANSVVATAEIFQP